MELYGIMCETFENIIEFLKIFHVIKKVEKKKECCTIHNIKATREQFSHHKNQSVSNYIERTSSSGGGSIEQSRCV